MLLPRVIEGQDGLRAAMRLHSTQRFHFRAPARIFWVALALRITVILVGHTYRIRADDHHFDFGFEAGRIAQSLVGGHGYGNPFNGPSGPTAWLPPLYPLLIASAFSLFGVYSNGAALFLLVLNSAASALIVPAIYEMAARCFDAGGIARRRSVHVHPVAWWAAWSWALYPAFLQYAVHWIWEMSLSACLFSWALVVALRLRGVGEQRAGTDAKLPLWAASGLLWGGIAMTNPSLLLMFPASAGWAVWPALRRGPWRAVFRTKGTGVAAAALAFAVVLTPWVIHNEHALHAFIPTRDNFGVELNRSTEFFWEGFPWGTAMPLWPGAPEFRHYVAVGELAYAHEKSLEAEHRIRAHPDLFARNTLLRFQMFWAGVPHGEDRHPAGEAVRMLNYSLLSVSGLLGLALSLRRRVIGSGLFAFAFLLVPLVYYGVTVQARFRHPLEPLLCVLSVCLLRSADTRHIASRSASAAA